MKRINDEEFKGWQAMNALQNNTNYWLHFSPDNTQAALVNTLNNEVIFITDRRTGEQIYKSPNSQRHAQFFYAMRHAKLVPRKVI
jgi:hypothetical protein